MSNPVLSDGAAIGTEYGVGELHKSGANAAPLQDPTANPLAVEFYRQHLALVCDDATMGWLVGQGVGHAARLAAGNIGVAGIKTTSNGFYEPSPHAARRAFITPVYGPVRPPQVPIMDPADPTPIDLVAWCMDQPGRWWLRRGIGVVLGEIEIVHAETYGEQIQVCRTPMSWLRNGGGGAVILSDWPAAWFLLHELQLVAEDFPHAKELRRRLRPPKLELPKILVRRAAA